MPAAWEVGVRPLTENRGGAELSTPPLCPLGGGDRSGRSIGSSRELGTGCELNPRWSPRTFRKRIRSERILRTYLAKCKSPRASDRVATLPADGSSIAQPRGARTAGAASAAVVAAGRTGGRGL